MVRIGPYAKLLPNFPLKRNLCFIYNFENICKIGLP